MYVLGVIYLNGKLHLGHRPKAFRSQDNPKHLLHCMTLVLSFLVSLLPCDIEMPVFFFLIQ